MRPSLALPIVAALAGLALVAACRSATEIVLDVRTDAPCSNPDSWQGVAIAVGEPGVDVESRSPTLITQACGAAGEVGTLVIVPSGANDATVGIRVVAGITRKPEDCAANAYQGCIVSRRTLTYIPHQAQHVVVDLTSDCIGDACDLTHTCVDGSCTDVVTATPPVALDGGVYDPGPTVRCGDDGTRCPANDPSEVCCVVFDFDGGTGKGACVPPASCPSTSATLYCDDTVDCPQGDASDPIVCCEVVQLSNPERMTNSACVANSACAPEDDLVLCQDRGLCPASGGACGPDSYAPGYYNCGAGQ